MCILYYRPESSSSIYDVEGGDENCCHVMCHNFIDCTFNVHRTVVTFRRMMDALAQNWHRKYVSYIDHVERRLRCGSKFHAIRAGSNTISIPT